MKIFAVIDLENEDDSYSIFGESLGFFASKQEAEKAIEFLIKKRMKEELEDTYGSGADGVKERLEYLEYLGGCYDIEERSLISLEEFKKENQ
jgi:hypothetical protein